MSGSRTPEISPPEPEAEDLWADPFGWSEDSPTDPLPPPEGLPIDFDPEEFLEAERENHQKFMEEARETEGLQEVLEGLQRRSVNENHFFKKAARQLEGGT